MSALTEEEGEQFKNMLSRIHTVFQAAKDMDVRVMVDAEQTYFQPAIARLAMEMMKKYNTEKAIVFNTYQVRFDFLWEISVLILLMQQIVNLSLYLQCYLKDAYKMLLLDLEQANRENFYFGAKLVRGAYMEQVGWHKNRNKLLITISI